jgi:hypothetical protein
VGARATTAADAARDELVAHLRADAAAHDAERFDAIGRRFDDVERHFPRGTGPGLALRRRGERAAQRPGAGARRPAARSVAMSRLRFR